ncbi:MAG: tRNA 2-selenouridine(34) synthase MnmH [SAR324 cluster bacterium]|nr:tRNA 2-selenouridine(34) synthase MnmH [SAR324 cluster bacterium]
MTQNSPNPSDAFTKDLHKSKALKISVAEAMGGSQTIIDVRAPIEFDKGAIPASLNFPLLHDHERHEIGILYKQVGQQAAIEQGYEFLQKNFPKFVSEVMELKKLEPIILSCARGGMRSQVMTNLFRNLGLDATQLEGGYKGYRNWVLQNLENLEIPKLVVLQGQTGVGKTKVIHLLPNSIDLEGLAHHRGSLFGGIGLKPTNQKNFEADLVDAIGKLDLSKPVYIEGESKKIGPVNLPAKLYKIMNDAPIAFLSSPLSVRIERIEEEYITEQPENRPRLREMVASLKEFFGKAGVAGLLENFDQGNYEPLLTRILVEYYDPKYSHCLKGVDFAQTIDTSDLELATREIQKSFK